MAGAVACACCAKLLPFWQRFMHIHKARESHYLLSIQAFMREADAMSEAATAQKVDYTTTGALTFTVRQAEKPYFLSTALTGGEAEVHFKTEERRVVIKDMRGRDADVDRG